MYSHNSSNSISTSASMTVNSTESPDMLRIIGHLTTDQGTALNQTLSPDIYDTPASDWERYFILLWSTFCALVSIPGNTSVLVASGWYHAIRLDNVSVILIRNLAAADLVYAITVILPTTWSVLQQKWVLGPFLCNVQFFLGYLTCLAGVILVCTLNISKLTTLLFPLHARTRAKRTGRFISLLIWGIILVALLPVVLWVVTGLVEFSSSSFKCDGTYDASNGQWWLPVYSIIFGLLPIILVVVTTVWLLHFVKKVRGLQKQSVITNIIISVVYIVAIFPYVVLQGSYIALDPEKNKMFYEYFYRFSVFVIWINSTANPLIYYFTILSYHNFVKRMFKCNSPKKTATVISNKLAHSLNDSSAFYPKDLGDVVLKLSI